MGVLATKINKSISLLLVKTAATVPSTVAFWPTCSAASVSGMTVAVWAVTSVESHPDKKTTNNQDRQSAFISGNDIRRLALLSHKELCGAGKIDSEPIGYCLRKSTFLAGVRFAGGLFKFALPSESKNWSARSISRKTFLPKIIVLVGEPQRQIAVTRPRRTDADEIAATQARRARKR
jgi:hypothetical protein